MSFLTDSKGNLSFIRLSILIAVIGTLFLGGSIMTFMFDQQSRRAPLHIELPQGAQPWGAPRVIAPGNQIVYYRVPGGDAEALAEFYDGKMQQHYGTTAGDQGREACVRNPTAGHYTADPNDAANAYVAGYVADADHPLFVWKCLFDRSGLNSTQYTLVRVYPGAPDANPDLNSEGSVVITYEQHWQTD